MPNKTYNTRAPQMWEIVSRHVDFAEKSVVDYGFGYGDMLIYAYEAGAQEGLMGVDKNPEMIRLMEERMIAEGIRPRMIPLHIYDLDRMGRGLWTVDCDIAICFSVLPYLEEPFAFLKYLHKMSKVTLIECQYAGDGPGFDWLDGDFTMAEWLGMAGWRDYGAIGKTFVEDRNCYRTIWKCER